MACVMIIGSGTAAAIAGLLAETEYVVVTKLPEPPLFDETPCYRDIIEVDELKPSMNFYQTKMHRRKKGGKVSFR